jgi:hypothetical protein
LATGFLAASDGAPDASGGARRIGRRPILVKRIDPGQTKWPMWIWLKRPMHLAHARRIGRSARCGQKASRQTTLMLPWIRRGPPHVRGSASSPHTSPTTTIGSATVVTVLDGHAVRDRRESSVALLECPTTRSPALHGRPGASGQESASVATQLTVWDRVYDSCSVLRRFALECVPPGQVFSVPAGAVR